MICQSMDTVALSIHLDFFVLCCYMEASFFFLSQVHFSPLVHFISTSETSVIVNDRKCWWFLILCLLWLRVLWEDFSWMNGQYGKMVVSLKWQLGIKHEADYKNLPLYQWCSNLSNQTWVWSLELSRMRSDQAWGEISHGSRCLRCQRSCVFTQLDLYCLIKISSGGFFGLNAVILKTVGLHWSETFKIVKNQQSKCKCKKLW